MTEPIFYYPSTYPTTRSLVLCFSSLSLLLHSSRGLTTCMDSLSLVHLSFVPQISRPSIHPLSNIHPIFLLIIPFFNLEVYNLLMHSAAHSRPWTPTTIFFPFLLSSASPFHSRALYSVIYPYNLPRNHAVTTCACKFILPFIQLFLSRDRFNGWG